MLFRTRSLSGGVRERRLRVEKETAYFPQGRSKWGRRRLEYCPSSESSGEAPEAAREARALPRIETGALPRFSPSRTNRATPRGTKSFTASAIARICSGVVPQQPPSKFSHPFSAHFCN